MIQAIHSFNRLTGVMLFSSLALLPSLVHLTWLAAPATHPVLAAGPVLAGLGMAARFSHTRVGLAGLGTLIAGLIWTANWLMMAGSGCCSTM